MQETMTNIFKGIYPQNQKKNRENINIKLINIKYYAKSWHQ